MIWWYLVSFGRYTRWTQHKDPLPAMQPACRVGLVVVIRTVRCIGGCGDRCWLAMVVTVRFVG